MISAVPRSEIDRLSRLVYNENKLRPIQTYLTREDVEKLVHFLLVLANENQVLEDQLGDLEGDIRDLQLKYDQLRGTA